MDDLNSYIEAFELAHRAGGPVDLPQFAPRTDHPQYREIVVELLRVDLEWSWAPGQASRLDAYRLCFPDVLNSPEQLAPVAFEEYRQRRIHGEAISRDDYCDRLGINTQQWPELPVGSEPDPNSSDSWLAEMSRTAPESANCLAGALRQMPEVGEQFGEFKLLGELGRGALGRVFLARQDELSQRLVALKVSPRLTDEPQRLAQLQHTNIVPVYSLHHRGSLQAICMPYLGASTLADLVQTCQRSQAIPQSGQALISTITGETAPTVESFSTDSDQNVASRTLQLQVKRRDLQRWESMSYVEAVVWVMARTADGLAHAHDHGIVHCDLKPANILLSDDGQPIILDFHLAASRTGAYSSASMVGGTLPYMAPEHIAAIQASRGVNHLCDLYSLGAVMFELLTGQLPYPVPRGSFDDVTERMIIQRQEPIPNARTLNPALSPGLAAILAHCLEPLPTNRYQSAHDLKEDLQCHLDHLPLRHAPDRSLRERSRKWMRRHPRLSSGASVMIVATAVLALAVTGWWLRGKQIARRDAFDAGQRFAGALNQVRAELNVPGVDSDVLAAGILDAERALSEYGDLSDPNWRQVSFLQHLPAAERERQLTNISDMLYLMAAGKAQRAVRETDSEAARLYREALAANRKSRQANPHPDSFPAIELQCRRILTAQGSDAAPAVNRPAVPDLAATPRQSRQQLAWQYAADGNFSDAATIYQRLVQTQSRDWTAWFSLGSCQLAQQRMSGAEASFTATIALAPKSYLGHFGRGLCFLSAKQYQAASDDFSRVLELQPSLSAALVNRALAAQGLGEPEAALVDLTAALEAGATQTRIYFLRSRVRSQLGDASGAQKDREMGLSLRPRDELSWVARGVAHLSANPEQARSDFREALRINPSSYSGLQDLAHVLSERLARTEEAIPFLSRLAELAPSDSGPVASRGVLNARLGNRQAAVNDAQQALRLSQSPLNQYQVAGIYALTSRTHPEDVRQALQLLRQAFQQDASLENLAFTDPDLRTLVNNANYHRLLDLTRSLRQFPSSKPSTASHSDPPE